MNVHDKCSQCGFDFPPDLVRVPCPKCGCPARQISASVSESVTARDALSFKIKESRTTGRSKSRVEGFTRYVSSQKAPLVKHDRMIDRGEDRYFEHVEDANTGDVLHHHEEPLSAHVGHGTAKTKSDPSAT